MTQNMGITSILKGGIGLYIKSFLATLVFAIISVLVPYHLVSHFSIEKQLQASIEGTQEQLMAILPELATSSVLSIFMYCVCVSIVLLMLYQYTTIGRFNIKASIIAGFKRFFKFFIAYLIFTIIFSVPWMIMYSLPPNVAMIAAVVYSILAIMVVTYLFLFPVYLVCQDMGIKDALLASIQAVKGKWFTVFLMVVFLGITYSALRYVFSQVGIALPIDSLGENLGVISDMVLFALTPALALTLYNKIQDHGQKVEPGLPETDLK